MIGLRAYLAAGLAVAALAGGLWINHVLRDRADLRRQTVALAAELAVQRQIAEQAQEARAVAQAHRAREAERAARYAATIETLLTGDLDNADLALDPWITRLLDCLRRGDPDDDCRAGSPGRPAGAGSPE